MKLRPWQSSPAESVKLQFARVSTLKAFESSQLPLNLTVYSCPLYVSFLRPIDPRWLLGQFFSFWNLQVFRRFFIEWVLIVFFDISELFVGFSFAFSSWSYWSLSFTKLDVNLTAVVGFLYANLIVVSTNEKTLNVVTRSTGKNWNEKLLKIS